MMANRVGNINLDILIECREQMGVSLAVAAGKVSKIASIESGESLPPTLIQLDKLSALYHVPSWVFVERSLPLEYQFGKSIPAFRMFAESKGEIFGDSKIRGLIAKVSQLRDLILEIRNDIGEPLEPFSPPAMFGKNSSDNISEEVEAKKIAEWLDLELNIPFNQRRKALEERGVFVFLTSKYKGWSHVDKYSFRGLAIHHDELPVIIINDGDANKAQSFTLFHELGHLLRNESALDNWQDHHQEEEKWCDKLSGSILMPQEIFLRTIEDIEVIDDLKIVKEIASKFNASTYACLVRLRQLNKVHQSLYEELEKGIKWAYNLERKKFHNRDGGPSRNRAKEIFGQYGSIYTKAIFQAYYDKEIGLHKLCNLFELKRVDYVKQLESML